MICPGLDDIRTAALALLPRGRAWSTAEIGPRPGSVLHAFWTSAADHFAFLAARLCALREEFWCATHVETHPEWLAEYALPDACDPFPDLCAKIAAVGGTRCDYYALVAARMGWSITCTEVGCGACCGCAEAGAGVAGDGILNGTLVITVDLSDSPAATVAAIGPVAGCLEAGAPVLCDADVTGLACLIARIVPAHVLVTYVLTP
jgi:uncharacterized protein YmfQ (DUF2313 family)